MGELAEELLRQEEVLHELQFRDKIKSAEYHYSFPFAFNGFFEEKELFEELFEKIKLISREFGFSSFKLGISWPEVEEAHKAHLKLSIQTALLKKIEEELKKKMDFSSNDLEFLIDFPKKSILVRVQPVFVKGRYCKFSREIAQTEFFCNKCRGKGCWYCNNTGHFSSESVEQLLGKYLVSPFEGKLLIMHGAGREDMDVLMLGKGRPFIAEILMPKKRSANLKSIEKKINSELKEKISVNSLEFCSPRDVSQLKDTMHDKIYSAYVVCDKETDLSKLKLGEEILVAQKTPTRVAKRRANMERAKIVVLQSVKPLSKVEFILTLKTSHGTYVKEFISGDDNKTNPSLSSMLGIHATCKLLDVKEICE